MTDKRKPGRPISTLPRTIFYRRLRPEDVAWFTEECERLGITSRRLFEDMRAAYEENHATENRE